MDIKKLLRRFSVTILASLFLLCCRCYAAEKTVNITLPEDAVYVTAKFIVTTEYEADYKITLISPSGQNEYEAEKSGDKEYSCSVQDPSSGVWTVKVVLDPSDMPGEGGEIEESDDDESSEEDSSSSVTDIGKIGVKFEGSKRDTTDASDDIKVASDIAGISMYFIDETLVVEWTDKSCGTVDVKVVDPKTKQELGHDGTAVGSYKTDIDSSEHSEVEVTIVPSTSTRIAGAEQTYTMSTKNVPLASVSFDEVTVTNKDYYNAYVTCEKPYLVRAENVKGREIYSKTLLKTGENTVPLETETDNNEYVLYLIDTETGYMRTYRGSVRKDVIAPTIQLVDTYDNITTQNESVTFEGAIDPDYESFTINDTEVEVEGDHTFIYEYKLKEGVNNIVLRANDEAGNESVFSTTVTRVIPKEKPIPWKNIIIGLLLVIVGVVIFWNVFGDRVASRRGQKEKPSKKKESTRTPEPEEDDDSGLATPKDYLFAFFRVIIPVSIVIIVCNFLVLPTTVMSGSMEPTLNVGQLAVYNRLAYVKGEIKRGDIISFYSDELGAEMAKRVIGIPGDEISFQDGYVVINGQVADESDYIPADIETNCNKTFTVPSGTVFVLGDNRENSYDSRFFSQPYIPMKKIDGRFMGQFGPSFVYYIQRRFQK